MSEQELQTKQLNPWDQQPGEPSEAYARFLVYRNLGPGRSLDAAYGIANVGNRRKSSERSGTWQENATAHRWRERAARWDVAQLSVVVPSTAGVIFEAIAEFARQVLAEVQAGTHKPKSWTEVKDALIVLAGFVSPDVITATIDHASRVGDEKPGGGGADDGPAAAA